MTSSVAFFLVSSQPASAIVLITGREVGNNVVFEFEGEITDINTTGFIFDQFTVDMFYHLGQTSFINNDSVFGGTKLIIGNSYNDGIHFYFGLFKSTPGNFGTNPNEVFPDSSTGDSFGFNLTFLPSFTVPAGYTGGQISGTSTYNNSTFASLGFDTTQTYDWVFENDDYIRLQFETATPVPEPLTIMGTLLAGGLGFAFKKKQKVS